MKCDVTRIVEGLPNCAPLGRNKTHATNGIRERGGGEEGEKAGVSFGISFSSPMCLVIARDLENRSRDVTAFSEFCYFMSARIEFSRRKLFMTLKWKARL